MIVTSIGAAAIDVTTTYVDQEGNPAETTATVTVIPANSQSGVWIKLILNVDDTEVRDVTSITVTGGTNGDKFQIVGLIPGRTLSYVKKVWDSFSIEPLSGNNHNKPAMFSMAKLTPDYYPAPNPQMRPFIAFDTGLSAPVKLSAAIQLAAGLFYCSTVCMALQSGANAIQVEFIMLSSICRDMIIPCFSSGASP